MRYAVYYTPPPEDSLAVAAAAWLGRDAFTGAVRTQAGVAPLTAAEVAFHTAAARRYGFHATLKAPFALAGDASEATLDDALDRFAATQAPVVLPAVALRQIDGFFALVPAVRSPELDALAADIVSTFDRFRAPLTEADIRRRNPEALSPAQLSYLHQWGYPHVFDAFRFHMTLTGRVAGDETVRVRQAIESHFAAFIGKPLEIATIALFVEPEPGAPFNVLSHHALGRVPERKSA